MEGLKTSITAGMTAIVMAAIAFGWDITPEQKVAVMGVVGAVIVPGTLAIVRIYTKAPMRGLTSLQKSLGVIE